MILPATALALLLGSAPAVAQDMSGMKMDAQSDDGDAQIVVTINPEARVSAVLRNPLPPSIACGTPTTLRIKIINQGGITAPLRIRLIDPPRGLILQREDTALSGHDEEQMLHLMSDRKEVTDLTVAFSFNNDPGDLASRDRVHLLLGCRTDGVPRSWSRDNARRF